jgi:hypothetical protein
MVDVNDERQIQEVLARYVRAADNRDGTAQSELFTADAPVQIHSRTGVGGYEPVGDVLVGGEAVRYAVENFMAPHPEGGFSHHTTADHIIEVDGDDAHLNAQFIVFEVRGAARPADGWPQDTAGVQGTVRPTESGYYDTTLRRIDGEWKIIRHDVLLDMPMVLPGA